MDNKQDRQFYWEVKQFMGNSPNPVSQEKKTSPSLVENIKNVLNKNELYRPTSFNPSISSPNTINNAIGAMEQSKNLGASHNAAHGSNVYGNAFANTPKNLNEAKDNWNWKAQTREENIAHGREVRAAQDAKDRTAKTDRVSGRSTSASTYYSTKDGISGTPTEHAEAARNKTLDKLDKGKELDANDLFYLQYGIGSGNNWSPEQIADYHKKAGGSQKSYELPKATSTDPNADPSVFNTSDKKISPMYWVTHSDFETATGERYDARNAKHRQLFFDLNSSGESNVAPTAGVGQGPAYDSLEYHTMRRRPANIPQFGTPQARYDTVDGTVANTTSQSRGKAQWDADDAAALKRIDAEAAKRDVEIGAEAKRIVSAEQKAAALKKATDTKENRQGYIDQISDTLNKDGSRTIKEPIFGKKDRTPTGTMTSDAQRSVTDNAANALQDMMRSGSDFMKKSLMQTQPMQGQQNPAGGYDPDIQRGYNNDENMYGSGTDADPRRYSPYVDRSKPGVGVSNIINNLVKSVGDSGQNIATELQRIMKLNTAQTYPITMQDKLYGDTSPPLMDTQERTPPAPHADYVYPNPFNPDVKSDIDAEDYNIKDDSESTGGMNEPMDLSDFPDTKATTSKPAGDYVKDIIKPFQDAADQQSTQDKINDILKNLGTSDSKKTSRRSKRKRKETTRVAMVGEAVVTPPPPTYFEKAKDLAKDAGKAAKEVGSNLAWALPGFHYGSQLAQEIAKTAGEDTGENREQILKNDFVDTSKVGLVYDWPIATFVGALTSPYVKQLATGLPRALGLGVGVRAALSTSAAIASTESMAAMAGLASPVGLAVTLGPAAAYGTYKLGEKGIKSYYDVNDKDYEAAQKEQEKYEKDMEKRGYGRIPDTGRSETEIKSMLAPQDVSDDEINAAIKASRARPSPTK